MQPYQNSHPGTSLVVQWLRLCTANARGPRFDSWSGNWVPHAPTKNQNSQNILKIYIKKISHPHSVIHKQEGCHQQRYPLPPHHHILLWETVTLLLKDSYTKSLAPNSSREAATWRTPGLYEKEIHWLILRHILKRHMAGSSGTFSSHRSAGKLFFLNSPPNN